MLNFTDKAMVKCGLKIVVHTRVKKRDVHVFFTILNVSVITLEIFLLRILRNTKFCVDLFGMEWKNVS